MACQYKDGWHTIQGYCVFVENGQIINRSQIATAIALRDLHCFSYDTINDRILLQTKIYLAQEVGLLLGYRYSWCIHGLYSTDLMDVAYEIIPKGSKSIEGKRFKEPYASMIKRVNDLEFKIKRHKLEISVVHWYELVAIVAYWYKHGKKTKETIVENIKRTNPQFTKELTKAAYASYATLKGGV